MSRITHAFNQTKRSNQLFYIKKKTIFSQFFLCTYNRVAFVCVCEINEKRHLSEKKCITAIG